MGKKTILITCCAVALCVAAFFGVSLATYYGKMNGLVFSSVDVRGVPDGKYVGKCDVGLIAVEAEVTMKDGRIEHIDLLEHKNGRGKPAESIVAEIIARQDTAVDVVSGATNSSKVIRKAVENALQSR